ncbi:unnamed protein product, partial [Didymodactylos carnosus]
AHVEKIQTDHNFLSNSVFINLLLKYQQVMLTGRTEPLEVVKVFGVEAVFKDIILSGIDVDANLNADVCTDVWDRKSDAK